MGLNPLYAVGIAAAVFTVDYLWALYIRYVSEKAAHKAAIFGTCIYILAAINVLAYTSNHWYLIPAMIGGYAGTWYAVHSSKKGNT